MLSRLRAVRTAGGDAGLTLIEVLVGATLAAMVMFAGVQILTDSTTQTNRVVDQSLDGNDAKTAIERIASELRLADTPQARPGFAAGRFETITPVKLVFYANVNPASRAGMNGRTPPTRVELIASGSTLTENTYAPLVNYAAPASPTPSPSSTPYPTTYAYTGNYPTAPTTTSTLVRNLATDGAGNALPVFTYYAGNSEPPLTPATPTAPAGSPTPTPSVTVAPTLVASVTVVLTLRAKAGNADQVVQTTVAITGALG